MHPTCAFRKALLTSLLSALSWLVPACGAPAPHEGNAGAGRDAGEGFPGQYGEAGAPPSTAGDAELPVANGADVPKPTDDEYYAQGTLPPHLEEPLPLVEITDEAVLNAIAPAQPMTLDLTAADLPPEMLAQLGLHTKSVIGTADTRRPVADTSSPPFSSVVFIKAYWSTTATGGYGMCSGTLISPDAVLTAAHCVYADKKGGRARSVQVIPGMYDSGGKQGQLAGIGSAWGAALFIPSGYRDPNGYQYEIIKNDYAVIRLKTRIGDRAGYRPYGVLKEQKDRFIQLAAYHKDLCPVKVTQCYTDDPYVMHQSADRVRKVLADGIFNHYIDMMPGSSGGGITSDGAEYNTVIGINVAQSSTVYNMGLFLTPSIYYAVRDYVERR